VAEFLFGISWRQLVAVSSLMAIRRIALGSMTILGLVAANGIFFLALLFFPSVNHASPLPLYQMGGGRGIKFRSLKLQSALHSLGSRLVAALSLIFFIFEARLRLVGSFFFSRVSGTRPPVSLA